MDSNNSIKNTNTISNRINSLEAAESASEGEEEPKNNVQPAVEENKTTSSNPVVTEKNIESKKREKISQAAIDARKRNLDAGRKKRHDALLTAKIERARQLLDQHKQIEPEMPKESPVAEVPPVKAAEPVAAPASSTEQEKVELAPKKEKKTSKKKVEAPKKSKKRSYVEERSESETSESEEESASEMDVSEEESSDSEEERRRSRKSKKTKVRERSVSRSRNDERKRRKEAPQPVAAPAPRRILFM